MSEFELTAGTEIEGARLVKPITESADLSVWRGATAQGHVAVYVCKAPAESEDAQRFIASAYNHFGIAQSQPIEGVLQVRAVRADGLAFVADYHGSVGSVEAIGAIGWDLSQRLAFFKDLCATVERLHAIGQPHGSLIPACVLFDGQMRPCVAGIAMFDPKVLGTKPETQPFVAPELLQGEEPTFVSDVFALGQLLHGILGDVPAEVLAEDIPALRPLAAVAPAGLVRIARKALCAYPTARYQSVALLLADLENYEDVANVGVGHADVGDGGPVVGPQDPTAGLKLPTSPKAKETSKTDAEPKSRVGLLVAVLVLLLIPSAFAMKSASDATVAIRVDLEPGNGEPGVTALGAADATLEADPSGGSNRVAKITRRGKGGAKAGAILSIDAAPLDTVPSIPVNIERARATIQVRSPEPKTKFQVRISTAGDDDHAVTVEAETKGPPNQWETLELNFGLPMQGSRPLAKTGGYNRVSVFPAPDKPGDTQTYYVDDFFFY